MILLLPSGSTVKAKITPDKSADGEAPAAHIIEGRRLASFDSRIAGLQVLETTPLEEGIMAKGGFYQFSYKYLT